MQNSKNNKNDITALVLTYNGERLLESCLRSLSFCNKILVVDSFSSDKTLQIAAACGATVLQNTWQGPGPQFIFAFQNIQSTWVLCLDQDEICTDELKEQVLEAIKLKSNNDNQEKAAVSGKTAPGKTIDKTGFFVRRRSWYFNRFMYHSGWYPDYLLRLFQPEKMQVKVSGAHYSFHPKGQTGKLRGEILHYPYENFEQNLDKLNSYASQGAAHLRGKGRRGGIFIGGSRALWRFISSYILKAGFLDGRAGFISAVHSAFYTFIKYVRIEQSSWGAPFDHK